MLSLLLRSHSAVHSESRVTESDTLSHFLLQPRRRRRSREQEEVERDTHRVRWL